MSMKTDREYYERLNNQLWCKSKIDKHGRLTLPEEIRRKIGIYGRKAEILWIQINRKEQENLYLIEIGVKKKKRIN